MLPWIMALEQKSWKPQQKNWNLKHNEIQSLKLIIEV